MLELRFLPKLLLQHDSSPQEVLEDVHGAFLRACQQHAVRASVSPCGEKLAVALGQRLVLLRLFPRGGGNSHAAVEFVSAVDAPETVTALAWLAASGQSTDECVLLGTSTGHAQLHSAATGALLLRQRLHGSAAVGAAVRWSGCGADPEDASEDVTLAFADAAVRLPAWEVWAAVRWHAGRGGGGWWGGGAAAASGAAHQLTFSKFLLPKSAGPRWQAVCLGPPLPSLQAALAGRAEQHRRLLILTVGAAPPLASYEGEESAAPGLLSLVSDLASSTAASLLGRARAYVPRPAAAAARPLLGGLRRRGGAAEGGAAQPPPPQQQQQRGGGRKEERIPGEPASLSAAVWDDQRCITQLALSPSGRLAACCDSLGRVLLVDTAATLVLRMLKGYRDAQVAWLVCGTGGGGGLGGGLGPLGGSSSSLGSLDSSTTGGWQGSVADLPSLAEHEGTGGGGPQAAASPVRTPPRRLREQAASPARLAQRQQASPARQQGRQRQGPAADGDAVRLGGGHLLVIYAPRRGVVELWEPQSLTRLGSVRCAAQLGLLLQQPARRGGASAAVPPNRCLLLDPATLHLTDLTQQLTDLL